MLFRIRMLNNWRGNIDGEQVYIQAGETRDVPRDVYEALVFHRELADPVPIEEIEKEQKPKSKKKPARKTSTAKKKPPAKKAFHGPTASKMVSESTDKD